MMLLIPISLIIYNLGVLKITLMSGVMLLRKIIFLIAPNLILNTIKTGMITNIYKIVKKSKQYQKTINMTKM